MLKHECLLGSQVNAKVKKVFEDGKRGHNKTNLGVCTVLPQVSVN